METGNNVIQNIYSDNVLILNYIKLVMLICITFLNAYILLKNKKENIINKYVQIVLIFVWFYLIFDNIESITRYYALENLYDDYIEGKIELKQKMNNIKYESDYKLKSMIGRVYDDIDIPHKIGNDSLTLEK